MLNNKVEQLTLFDLEKIKPPELKEKGTIHYLSTGTSKRDHRAEVLKELRDYGF